MALFYDLTRMPRRGGNNNYSALNPMKTLITQQGYNSHYLTFTASQVLSSFPKVKEKIDIDFSYSSLHSHVSYLLDIFYYFDSINLIHFACNHSISSILVEPLQESHT